MLKYFNNETHSILAAIYYAEASLIDNVTGEVFSKPPRTTRYRDRPSFRLYNSLRDNPEYFARANGTFGKLRATIALLWDPTFCSQWLVAYISVYGK